jgi:hypothetical protein
MYAPERDFAYNYPQMISCIIRAFNINFWPDLLEQLETANKDVAVWDETCKAKDCFCEFLNICCEDPEEKLPDVLKRSGFTDVHPLGQIAWFAMMGQVMAGQLFQGVRDVTPQGTQHSTISELMQVAQTAARLFNKVPEGLDETEMRAGFTQYARALKDLGLPQGELRKIVASLYTV